MLEVSRLEQASLRRLHETAAAEGRRLVTALALAETARDEALAVGKGAGGEAEVLRERLKKELDEKKAFETAAAEEIASKVGGEPDGRSGGQLERVVNATSEDEEGLLQHALFILFSPLWLLCKTVARRNSSLICHAQG